MSNKAEAAAPEVVVPSVSFKDAELAINLGGHKCVVRGSFDLVSEDFARLDTVAGALIVEDRSNAKLIEQLEHVETVEIDGEEVEVGVSYNPIDASRVEMPKLPLAPIKDEKPEDPKAPPSE